jgi:4-diphosphocytidyl-2-C-methyl-D-erythritol kinase
LTLVVPARAKLNLDLEVRGRTDDGFHDIHTHMQAIEFHDSLELTKADRTSMTLSGPFFRIEATKNSVIRAHAALQEESGRDLPTRFHLDKWIPPGSGMGGASSDAAAALRGLKAIHDLTEIDLAKVAPRIGADVPFFLIGGRAVAEGRGERLTQVPVEHEWFALAWPDIELSTAAVYGAWDEVGGDGANQLLRAASHVDPRVSDFAERLGEEWQMTGSGSAFFLRCPDEQSAQQAIAELECWRTVTHSVGAWA